MVFHIGCAVAADEATMSIKIPECGAIVTQVSLIGLMADGQPATMVISQVRLIDTIGVKRFEGPRVPGRIGGACVLELDVECPGAIAMTVTMVCRPRRSETDAVVDASQDVEVDSGTPES